MRCRGRCSTGAHRARGCLSEGARRAVRARTLQCRTLGRPSLARARLLRGLGRTSRTTLGDTIARTLDVATSSTRAGPVVGGVGSDLRLRPLGLGVLSELRHPAVLAESTLLTGSTAVTISAEAADGGTSSCPGTGTGSADTSGGRSIRLTGHRSTRGGRSAVATQTVATRARLTGLTDRVALSIHTEAAVAARGCTSLTDTGSTRSSSLFAGDAEPVARHTILRTLRSTLLACGIRTVGTSDTGGLGRSTIASHACRTVGPANGIAGTCGARRTLTSSTGDTGAACGTELALDRLALTIGPSRASTILAQASLAASTGESATCRSGPAVDALGTGRAVSAGMVRPEAVVGQTALRLHAIGCCTIRLGRPAGLTLAAIDTGSSQRTTAGARAAAGTASAGQSGTGRTISAGPAGSGDAASAGGTSHTRRSASSTGTAAAVEAAGVRAAAHR